jgi:hypothetical protein
MAMVPFIGPSQQTNRHSQKWFPIAAADVFAHIEVANMEPGDTPVPPSIPRRSPCGIAGLKHAGRIVADQQMSREKCLLGCDPGNPYLLFWNRRRDGTP